MIGGKMIGHRPISTSQHHPGAQRRQLRTGAIEAEQGQRGHGGRKPGKGMNLATSPQNECENRRRRPSRGLAHTPGTPIFALFRWTSERAASIRCPDGGSGQGSFASFLKGPLPPSGHRIERGTIDLQSDINCLPERSLLGAFGKQHDDYDHDVFNSAGSTLATPHFGPENGVHLTQHLPSPDRRRKLQEGTTSRPLGLETRKCPPTLKRSESCESNNRSAKTSPTIARQQPPVDRPIPAVPPSATTSGLSPGAPPHRGRRDLQSPYGLLPIPPRSLSHSTYSCMFIQRSNDRDLLQIRGSCGIDYRVGL